MISPFLNNPRDYINKYTEFQISLSCSQKNGLFLEQNSLPNSSRNHVLTVLKGHTSCLCPGPLPLQVTVGYSHTQHSHKTDR